jgi:hypothetical protein
MNEMLNVLATMLILVRYSLVSASKDAKRGIEPRFLIIFASKIRVGQLQSGFKTPVPVDELVTVDEF